MNNVLVIGSGGREHALGWKLAQSPHVQIVYTSNSALIKEPKAKAYFPSDMSKTIDFAKERDIKLIVVGAEDYLATGLVDQFHIQGFHGIFGPTKAATSLESDKFFSYEVMQALKIPQASSVRCFSFEEAIVAIHQHTTTDGIVIKNRGLKGGKGVKVCDTKEEAIEYVTQEAQIEKLLEVLVAERLHGEEFSVFGIADGERVIPLTMSFQDHKRLFDGDRGPNTGGMGAYGPAPIAPPAVVQEIADTVMSPLVQFMKQIKIPYTGFLYAGMMMTQNGPKVLEFNVRMGDPECEPAMMMLKSDLYEVLSLAVAEKADQICLEYHPGAACATVLASQGYPDSTKILKGLPISGIADAEQLKGVKLFHSGTKWNSHQWVTDGGRVLVPTAYSPLGIVEARRQAYAAAEKITIPGDGFQYRRDIAERAILHLRGS